MSPEAQRIAIAEACGWHRCGPYLVGRSGNQRIIHKGVHPRTSLQCELPSYLTDLNAMHEAENAVVGHLENNTFPLHKAADYVKMLQLVVGGVPGCYAHHCATADQRAEAFLRTIGKWSAARSATQTKENTKTGPF